MRKVPLDDRKQKILKAIVQEHVDTAEPVGSEVLVMHHDFGVRSATIRNEMAELSEMGYLRQPHTSAGRVPSDLGYRFYVDRLMGKTILPKKEASQVKERLESTPLVFDYVISQTCRLLTGLTSYTAVATQPATSNVVIQHIGLSRIANQKLLMIVVLSDGRVEHRVLNPGRPVQDVEVRQTAGLMAEKFIGTEITDTDSQITEPITGLAVQALKVLRQVAETLSAQEAEIWIEGVSNILKQPEFRDRARMESVVALLEERRHLYQMMFQTMLGPDVTIVIGSENPISEMQETSFVAARYKIGDRVAGTIGVVGPTRMDYRRAVAAVEAMANNLGALLTQLSLE